MTSNLRVYFDNAATSYPKPETVYTAVENYHRKIGVAVGRGATRTGTELQRIVDRCRARAARILGASTTEVNFTYSGTDSLNTALHGLLKPGDKVVTSCWEHNSVLRPLQELEQRIGIQTTIVGGDDQGVLDLDEFEQSITADTRLVILTHASNVTGVIQPVKQVVKIAHQHGAFVLLDAAQTAGHLPISVKELGIDFLACSGHKGLLGPLGTGLLVIRKNLIEQVKSFRQGGTGTSSESALQPATSPEKFESGNHNAPGICGLEAALCWIEEQSIEALSKQEQMLTHHFIEGVSNLPNITVQCASNLHRVGVVSLTLNRADPQVVAALLEEHFQVETRAGLHCSPLAHQQLGTKEFGGTIRFSIGPFLTESDIDLAIEAIGQIAISL